MDSYDLLEEGRRVESSRFLPGRAAIDAHFRAPPDPGWVGDLSFESRLRADRPSGDESVWEFVDDAFRRLDLFAETPPASPADDDEEGRPMIRLVDPRYRRDDHERVDWVALGR